MVTCVTKLKVAVNTADPLFHGKELVPLTMESKGESVKLGGDKKSELLCKEPWRINTVCTGYRELHSCIESHHRPTVKQLQMLLFPNALCCSLYKRNWVCAVTNIFTRKQFLPTSAGNVQEQLHFCDDQQRAFGISNISNCTIENIA